MEEIVVADLMRAYSMKLDEVLKCGYFRAHRLWDMWLECRAYDLMETAVAGNASHMSDEGRKEFYESLQNRQRRRYSHELKHQMPPEVFEQFEKKWEELEKGTTGG